MKQETIINIIENYFESFSNKNIEKLKEIYEDEISLKDWIASMKGKQEVILANESLFSQFPDLKININRIIGINDSYINNIKYIACQITIILDKDTTISVCDIIGLNTNNGKINSIMAYKC
jgi:hypothetical protein